MKTKTKSALELLVFFVCLIIIVLSLFISVYSAQMVVADVLNQSSPTTTVKVRGECYTQLTGAGKGGKFVHTCFITEGDSIDINKLQVDNAKNYKSGDTLTVRKYSEGIYVLEDKNAYARYFSVVFLISISAGCLSIIIIFALTAKARRRKKRVSSIRRSKRTS